MLWGQKIKKKDFYVSSNKQSSSFLEPKKHLEKHPEVTFGEKRLLEIKTLDSFNIEDCNFMNIDVQGFELEVLKGSEKTLNFVQTIYTEINTVELYDNCVLLPDLDKWLKQRGFFRKEIIMADNCGWGDAFYLKNN